MRILIAGGSGFIGQALVKHFQARGCAVMIIGRNKNKLKKLFGEQALIFDWQVLNEPEQLTHIDAVINLAGENIAGGLWTQARKKRLIASRINATQQLVKAFARFNPKPACFINASGVGIYPLSANSYEENWENKGESLNAFLGKLANAWENAAWPAAAMGIRVVTIRQGAVLGMSGGMLKSIVLPYKLGLGGRIGSGEQPFPWIALPDVVRAIDFIIQRPDLAGPINLVAPDLINQMIFAKALASALHRPARFVVPAWLLKMALGTMADELFLSGVKVIPKKLLAAGFIFTHPHIKEALANLLSD
jgi:uncharacterized protein (TIGR01777 family)